MGTSYIGKCGSHSYIQIAASVRLQKWGKNILFKNIFSLFLCQTWILLKNISAIAVPRSKKKSYKAYEMSQWIVEKFNEKPLLQEKFLKLWKNLAIIDRYFSISSRKWQYGNRMWFFPEYFFCIFSPNKNLTRKMLEMSLVVPILIRDELGTLHKILAL